MKIAFWSGEEKIGMTSSMAAAACVCSNVWDLKTVLLQSRNQKGDLYQKFDGSQCSCPGRRTRERLVTVRKGRMYYLMQPGYAKQEQYPEFFKKSMRRLILRAEKFADITFIDCGSGEDELAADILSGADVSVINISQGRQCLNLFFQKRHAFHGSVIYLVNQYQQNSICDKQYLNRLYRIPKEALAVIPDNQFFRYAGDNGKMERFILKYARCTNTDRQFYFMQELAHTVNMILYAGGFIKDMDKRHEGRISGCSL